MFKTISFIIVLVFTFFIACSEQKLISKRQVSSVSISNFCKSIGDRCRGDADCCSSNCNDSSICMRRRYVKGLVGEHCNLNSQCESSYCFQSKCLGKPPFMAQVGQYCTANEQCESLNCIISSKKCVGSSLQKGYVSQFCKSNEQCYSYNCRTYFKGKILNQCLGGGDDLARYGEICDANLQCQSQNCDFISNKCL